MRPTAIPSSARKSPLSYALGTAARVSLLRTLSAAAAPMSLTNLAREAGLNVRGVRRVVDELESIGAIDAAPGAGSRRLKIREQWSLADQLKALFAAEANREAQLLHQICVAVDALQPRPTAVWLCGPHAAGTDTPADPVTIGLLADASDAEMLARELERTLAPVSAELRCPVHVEPVTPMGLAAVRANPEPRRLIASRAPAVVLSEHETRGVFLNATRATALPSQAERDADALRRARAIGLMIRKDPSLMARATQALELRKERAPAGSRAILDEWIGLLSTSSPVTLFRLLTSPGERMAQLRQTIPFMDILRKDEQARFDRFLHEPEA